MKKYKLLGLCFAFTMGSLVSCDSSDDSSTLDTKVYINTRLIPGNYIDAGSILDNSITDEVESSFEVKFPVCITMPYAQNVQVKLDIKPELLEVYNAENGTNFKLFNKEALKIENATLTIKKGEMQSADSLKITLLDGSKMGDGSNFCLPIAITEITERKDLKISTNQSCLWATVEKYILNVKVVDEIPGTVVDHSHWVASPDFVGNTFTDDDEDSSLLFYGENAISYDLNGEETYKGFSITSEYGVYYETLNFQISNDGINWLSIGTVTLPWSRKTGDYMIQYVQFVKPVRASHIRFTFADVNGGMKSLSFSELNLYK